MLQLIGEHAQGQHLGLGHGFVLARTVRQAARQLRHLGDPAAVCLLLSLDREFQARTLAHSLDGDDAVSPRHSANAETSPTLHSLACPGIQERWLDGLQGKVIHCDR